MALTNCSDILQDQLLNLNSRTSTFSLPTGMIDLALSAENGAEVQAKMITKNGKNSKYTIERPANLCTDVAACGDAGYDCDDVEEAPMTECDTITGFDCITTKWFKTSVDAWRDLGQVTENQVFAVQVLDQMNKILDRVDKEALIAACTASEAATDSLKMIDPTTGAPYWETAETIMLDYADAGYATNPLLLGGRIAYKYDAMSKKVGMNNAGVNLGALSQFKTFYDKNVTPANCAPATVDNDVLLSFMPGVFNLLNWSANSGKFASRMDSLAINQVDLSSFFNSNGSTFEYATIMHPTKNVMFDIDIEFRNTNCEKGIYWQLKHYKKEIILPLIGCKDAGFTGLRKYDVCPEVAPSC